MEMMRQIRDSLLYIDNHLEEPITVSSVADAAFRFGWKTHSGFTRSFKSEFGFYPVLLKAMMMQIDDLGGSAMGHIFLKNTDIHSTKEQLLERLEKEMMSANIVFNKEELQRVYLQACHVYEGKKDIQEMSILPIRLMLLSFFSGNVS